MCSCFLNRQSVNETCNNSIQLEQFLHYSLIPSVICTMRKNIFLLLTQNSLSTKSDFFLVFLRPLNFAGAFSNRWSLAFAFGATANKVMIMFSEGYFPLQHVPEWVPALAILLGAMEVGLSSYPLFACLSTRSQIAGSALGFLYTGIWFVVMLLHITQCPHGQMVGVYENIIFYWPSLLCLIFLLGRFVVTFVKVSWFQFQTNQTEDTSFLEVHQAQYVQQLMRKPPMQQPEKSWIQQKIYKWDPYFQFPSRMICMAVLAIICLYMFVVMERYAYMHVSHVLETLELDFESLTMVLCPTGVWIFTTFTASLTCITYVFHILACYRKHMKRLWAGQKEFLPLVFSKLSSSQSVASIARYSGWQIAYILWGYLVIHIVQCLLGLVFMYIFVLPIMNGEGIKMLKSVGMVIFTIGIFMGFMQMQIGTASIFFLQPKISLDDKEKPLALDNRKMFHNFNYFLFFYNVMLGLSMCLFRLLCSVMVGAWLIARIDRTIMPKGYEAADMGFRTWIGMLFMDSYHTNPTLICFCHFLLMKTRERQQQTGTLYSHFSNLTLLTFQGQTGSGASGYDFLFLVLYCSKDYK
uniref:Stimulated by retinoic acid gene 6 protein-like n=1 Tax=Anolis carolinensis TaxID=28377 RepID=A0A803TYZ8_ANOCA